jgi:hypothetical protein
MPNPFKIFCNAVCLIFLLVVMGCHRESKPIHKKLPKKVVNAKEKEYVEVKYTEPQLIAFFDSVGKLPVEPLANKAAYYADSVFKTFTKPVSRQLSVADFALLKQAIRAKRINAHIAKKIFGEFTVDSNCNSNGLLGSVKKGYVYLSFYPFSRNENKFDEFAVGMGDRNHCEGAMLYYFRADKIIAKQDGYSRYGNDPAYFKNIDGENIVYRRYEFTDGSGIWWNNYFFYKYNGDNLIPVLNEPESCNAQAFWALRILWLESKIQKTNPLTIKMVYHQQFYNDNNDVYFNYGPIFLNDSTSIKYTWDESSKTLRGQYQQSKLSKAQILSYYLTDNEYLFINSHYQLLKALLVDKKQRAWLLDYLNKTKSHYANTSKSKGK